MTAVGGVMVDTVIDRVAVLRMLRLAPGSKPAVRADGELESILAELPALDAPSSSWVLAANNFASFPAGLRRHPLVALCLVTAGEPVSDLLGQLYSAHQYFRAAVLDAACNQALSAESDRLHDAVKARADRLGLHLTRRFSPGCPHMSLTCQRDIVGAVPRAAELGVRVHASGMIQPLKSLTFALGASGALRADQPRDFCDTCREAGCMRNRREEPQ